MMLSAGVGQREGIDTLEVTRQVISMAQQELGAGLPHAGILFASVDFDHAVMLEEIARRFPGMPLVGCTSAGDFSSAGDLSEDSITLMLLRSDALTIRGTVARTLSDAPALSVERALAPLTPRPRCRRRRRSCSYDDDDSSGSCTIDETSSRHTRRAGGS